MWGTKDPLILTQAAVNEGQGSITSFEHSGCDWSAFPGRSSLRKRYVTGLISLNICRLFSHFIRFHNN